ncbi:hypothetical protein QYE76_061274 [Lolium multiflorum]|uniref:Uncharacterized protein n=1 Tax=Lolium multiflorum TaxID=4521 RepID=A0AAD8S0N7_LOLMU|nr:hypothetical protein QYE76_061274 [Lolium multiflorum]
MAGLSRTGGALLLAGGHPWRRSGVEAGGWKRAWERRSAGAQEAERRRETREEETRGDWGAAACETIGWAGFARPPMKREWRAARGAGLAWVAAALCARVKVAKALASCCAAAARGLAVEMRSRAAHWPGRAGAAAANRALLASQRRTGAAGGQHGGLVEKKLFLTENGPKSLKFASN